MHSTILRPSVDSLGREETKLGGPESHYNHRPGNMRSAIYPALATYLRSHNRFHIDIWHGSQSQVAEREAEAKNGGGSQLTFQNGPDRRAYPVAPSGYEP